MPALSRSRTRSPKNGCSSYARSSRLATRNSVSSPTSTAYHSAPCRSRILPAAAASAVGDPDPDRRAQRGHLGDRLGGGLLGRRPFAGAGRRGDRRSSRVGPDERVPQDPLRALRPGAEVGVDGERDHPAGADRLVHHGRRAGQRLDTDRQARRGVVRRPGLGERRDRRAQPRPHRRVVLVHDPVARADARRQGTPRIERDADQRARGVGLRARQAHRRHAGLHEHLDAALPGDDATARVDPVAEGTLALLAECLHRVVRVPVRDHEDVDAGQPSHDVGRDHVGVRQLPDARRTGTVPARRPRSRACCWGSRTGRSTGRRPAGRRRGLGERGRRASPPAPGRHPTNRRAGS